jgi:hypothetical protein
MEDKTSLLKLEWTQPKGKGMNEREPNPNVKSIYHLMTT